MGKIIYNLRENRQGEVVSKENRAYDKFGRLAETAAGFGSKVTYAYDSRGRLARQVVDGSPIEYEYTKYGQLAGKHLGGKLNADASVTYEYSKSGQIVARTANGVRQTYEYDKKGQLLAVKDADGNAVERYAYDKAGNMLKKKILRSGRAGAPRTPQSDDYITTTFTFDSANQLVSSTTDGVTTRYAYDAAGRMVREGNKSYRYGYLDKVLSVTDGDTTRTFTYHADGQLATATVGGEHRAPRDTPQTETFLWDGLALIQRGDEQFVNEPHVGGGNPVASSKGTSYFNDALGTTVGSKSNGKYSAAVLTAFGENHLTTQPPNRQTFFTGKPYVEGLGHAFWMRNYRAGLAKWQSADPMGYPDGWNQLAYCGNGVTSAVDLWGCVNMNLFPFGTIQCRIADLYDESGCFTVAAHGAEIHDAIGNVIAVESLATGIRAKGWNGTDPIKLLSCDSGSSAADYCQKLANILGVSVYAADTPVWYIATGHFWYWYVNPFIDEDDPEYITSGAVKPYQKSSTDPTQPDYTRPGRYIEFKPE